MDIKKPESLLQAKKMLEFLQKDCKHGDAISTYPDKDAYPQREQRFCLFCGETELSSGEFHALKHVTLKDVCCFPFVFSNIQCS